MKSQKGFVLGLCLVLFFSLAFVIADRGGIPHNRTTNDSITSVNQSNKINYGLCVANQTKIKNSCFETAKNVFKNCETNIRQQVKNETLTNKTEIKNLKKNCRLVFKNSLTTCKVDFKLAKENCRQYQCRSYENFVNGSCIECGNNQTIVNGTCVSN